MKLFTEADVRVHGALPDCGSLYADKKTELIDAPRPFNILGRQETASGYGAKLTTRWKINFEGRIYRIYCTCYSNVGSCWILAKGRKIFIN